MDATQRYCYGLNFKNVFLTEKGKAFESFFARVMTCGFTGDFQPVRPYGAQGDLKCDGFRASDGTVFQCYAPDAICRGQVFSDSPIVKKQAQAV